MSVLAEKRISLGAALEEIAERAVELDRSPRFPTENFESLRQAGQLAAPIAGDRLSHDIGLVRAVAVVDGSTARILDGHLNALERLAIHDKPHDGRLLGVWGADPTPTEGSPARIERTSGGLVLRGVKVFCSGAGGVSRALVVARDEHDARRLAYVDVETGTSIDRDWYRASGLRASESHRVQFDGAPVLALLGGPDELAREPYFSRDAVRTAATWAGLTDAIVATTAAQLQPQPADDARLQLLGAMQVELGTIDRWLEHATTQLGDARHADLADLAEAPTVALCARAAIVDASRRVAEAAGRACGSRPLVRGGTLDRARRDLDLFLLQHRLEGKLAGLGRDTLAEYSP